MDKSNPRKRQEPEEPGVTKILPMDFHVGARLTDEAAEWEIIGSPYVTNAGKTAHVRVHAVSTSPRSPRSGPGERTSASA